MTPHLPLAALTVEPGALGLWGVAAVLAALALVPWLYRDVFRFAPRRVAWTLAGLRAAGLIALLLALIKPIWAARTESVEPGVVAVIVDDSRSMTMPDASGRPRAARAAEGVRAFDAALQRRAGGPQTVVALFDGRGEPAGDRGLGRADAPRTDLLLALDQASAAVRGRPLAGIVLVSDGADNSGRTDMAPVRDGRVPVYTVGFRDPPSTGRVDVAVREVRAPERAIVHNTIKAEVVLAKQGAPALEATVVVRRGGAVLASQAVRLAPGAGETTVALSVPAGEAGTFVLTALVSVPGGDADPRNDRRLFPLQVDPEPVRVYYIEGVLRHEFTFLKKRFEDDPDVSLVSLVRRANPERGTAPLAAELLTPERLAAFDVLILGDIEGRFLHGAEYAAIRAWVEAGHALLILGGYSTFGPDGLRDTPLADVLPLVFAAEAPYQDETPFALALTDEGRRHPIFTLSGDRVQDAAAWASAPPLDGAARVARAKPGASVLAVRPPVAAGEPPMPAIAVQRYGRGRVLAMTVDTTWRWSRFTRVAGLSDTLYARFWSQMLRWLAGRDAADARAALALTTDRLDGDVGRPIAVRAVRTPRPGESNGVCEVTVEAVRDDAAEAPVPVPVRAGSADPDRFDGTYTPSAPGRVMLTATLRRDGRVAGNAAREIVARGADDELAHPEAQPAFLRAIATASGGSYLEIDDLPRLAESIERTDRHVVRERRVELWDAPWLFLFFLAAVTGEWIVRRRNRLV